MADNHRRNGIYYTPTALAEYLVAPLITSPNLSILDPAYGEGALLLAAEKVYNANFKESRLQLFGCDIKPVNGLLTHLPEANLKKINFFDYPVENKFPLILMNPPYVRHHLQTTSLIKKMKSLVPETKLLGSCSDMWAYFLVKSISHLETNGSIGTILPWSFLQADYAQPLRKWIANCFGQIRLLTLNEKYFENAQERIVLMWLENYERTCTSIRMGSAKCINEEITFASLPIEKWNANKVSYKGDSNVDEIISKYKDYGFMEFDKFAQVKIGVVTGADDYFILSDDQAKRLGFKKRHLMPILTTSKDFAPLVKRDLDSLKKLIVLTKEDYTDFRGYLQKGVLKGYHLRAHSQRRTPWYKVIVGDVPDAFFPYRISKIPFLIMNDWGIQSTNSVHRIYFSDLSNIERKWIQVSLLSNASQLSLEAGSKTYGRGMLKIEPKSLKNALVVRRNDPAVNLVFMKVQNELKRGNKLVAMDIATRFINRELGIPGELSGACNNELSRIYDLRLS